ncbi:hypothetical protein [Actinomycetospora soli]|uniref:hypothetical protein n=1 Tax=Actinomycetospora soli TaxID=2893887 RepID=UPI001E52D4EF|nr:hypothetical protein [Actinomycetospora soli]MCD2190923.1 hypothetical protein [Actinomycetospora soli]
MRTALATLVVVATLPYLVLKALWLTGHAVGVPDPAFLASPGLHAANLVTAGMDAVAILLAVVLASGTRRPPAWSVLLPGWVGAGFLVPIVLTTAPGLLLDGGVAGGPEPLAPWVKPLVHVGFTLQGIGLVGLFAGYAWRRWAPTAGRVALPWARTVVRLAAVGAAGFAGVQVAQAAGLVPDGGPWSASAALAAVVKAALAVGGVVGAHEVTAGRGRRGHLVAAAAGSASMFSWGLYGTVMTAGGTVFAASSPVSGLAALVALLTGLVLGLAVLGAVAQPAVSEVSSTSASKQVRSPV